DGMDARRSPPGEIVPRQRRGGGTCLRTTRTTNDYISETLIAFFEAAGRALHARRFHVPGGRRIAATRVAPTEGEFGARANTAAGTARSAPGKGYKGGPPGESLPRQRRGGGMPGRTQC